VPLKLIPFTKEQIDSLYNQIYETENERAIFHEICKIIEDAHNGVMLDTRYKGYNNG
jgi:hypothetical protein